MSPSQPGKGPSGRQDQRQDQRQGQAQGPRPRQVTVAGWVALVGSTILLLSVFDSVSEVRSIETRESIEAFLSRPPGEGLGLTVERGVEILRALMLFSAAAYAAAVVLAIFVLQRHRGARIGFTVAAVAIMATAPITGGFLPALVAFAAIALWTGPSRDWFSGRLPATVPTGARDVQEGRLMAGQDPEPGPRPAPPERPYGEPQPPPPSYGEAQPPPPPYGEAPAPPYGTAPLSPSYGEAPPPYPQGPYRHDQPPHGYPPYVGYSPYQQQDPDKRPTTVTVAAWLTWVFSGLTLLAFVITLVAVVAAREEFMDALRAESAFQDLDISADDLVAGLWAVTAVLIFWCLAAIVLAVLAYRRVNWARVMLVVSAALTVLLSLVAITSLISAIPLIVAGAVVVLLFTGGANEWYSRKGGFLPGRRSFPPPGDPQQYGGQPPGRDAQEPPKNVW